jgi:hypothetical protein
MMVGARRQAGRPKRGSRMAQAPLWEDPPSGEIGSKLNFSGSVCSLMMSRPPRDAAACRGSPTGVTLLETVEMVVFGGILLITARLPRGWRRREGCAQTDSAACCHSGPSYLSDAAFLP